MSMYDNDARVRKVEGPKGGDRFYYVAAPSDDFVGGVRSASVWRNQEDGGWAAQYGDDSNFTTHATDDDAIRSLIGDPQ